VPDPTHVIDLKCIDARQVVLYAVPPPRITFNDTGDVASGRLPPWQTGHSVAVAGVLSAQAAAIAKARRGMALSPERTHIAGRQYPPRRWMQFASDDRLYAANMHPASLEKWRARWQRRRL